MSAQRVAVQHPLYLEGQACKAFTRVASLPHQATPRQKPLIRVGSYREQYRSVCCYTGVPQDIRFSFQIFQSILHDIADADDADELPVRNHNQMAHAVIGH